VSFSFLQPRGTAVTLVKKLGSPLVRTVGEKA
jgi:hypothetical protein